MKNRFDVIILGAGPAGLSLASALVDRTGDAVSVLLVSPEWPQPWPNNYGVWEDELQHNAQIARCVTHRFEAPHVVLPRAPHTPRPLQGRAYVKLDNLRLRELLASRFLDGGGQILTASAESIEHEPRWSVVRCEGGEQGARFIRGRLIVDATGGAPRFVERPEGSSPGFQVAYGIHARVERAPRGWLDTMRIMDWIPASGGRGEARKRDEVEKPSFLYGMRLGEEEVFVEETSLVARPALSMRCLKARLATRLEREGVTLGEPLAIERCVIPMGHEIPAANQRVVAVGAAASKVHPATGYQVARTLREAKGLGEQLAGLLARPLHGDELSREAWRLIWSEEQRSRHALFVYGMELLLAMDLDALDRFYHAFFGWPERLWKGYWSDTLAHHEILEAMMRQLATLEGTQRLDLILPAIHSSTMRRRLFDGVVKGAYHAVVARSS